MPRVTPAHEQAIRSRIVVAAHRAFGQRGYHRATIADVVRASGLSVGAIYTYFRGKEALYYATCDLSAGQGLGELADRVAAGRTTAERLAIAIGFFLDALDSPPGQPAMASFLVQAWAQAESEPAAREMLTRRRAQLATTGELLIREGVVRGELPTWLDVEGLTGGLLALLDGLLLQRVEAGPAWRRDDAERRARAVLEVALGAVAATGRPDLPRVAAKAYSLLDDLAPSD